MAAAIDIEVVSGAMSPARLDVPRLTGHLRALALMQPLQHVEDAKSRIQCSKPEAIHRIDARYLALATIEYLINRMGVGALASRAEILDHLTALAHLQCRDIGSDDAAAIAEHIFSGLTNARERRARFVSTHFDPQHAERVTIEFALLRAEPAPDGSVGYRLTQEAIEVHLNLLAQDPLTATQVNQMIVEEYLRRGLYDEAATAAERARTNSIRLAEAVRSLMSAAHRAIRKVRWEDGLGPRLEEARDLLDASIGREGAMLLHLNDTAAEVSEEIDRRHIARLRQLLLEVQARHRRLSVIVQRTASEYLALQADALKLRPMTRLPDLEREILEPCLQAPMDLLTRVAPRMFDVISGPLPPLVFDISAAISAFEPEPAEEPVAESAADVCAPSAPMPPTFDEALIERTEAFARALIKERGQITLEEILQHAAIAADPDPAFERCLFWVLEQAIDPRTGTVAGQATILNRHFALGFVSGKDVQYSPAASEATTPGSSS